MGGVWLGFDLVQKRTIPPEIYKPAIINPKEPLMLPFSSVRFARPRRAESGSIESEKIILKNYN